jgi:uncharacterized protein (TIGR02598 family)
MRGNRHGFSLIEVCLAIGVVVFALTALMGLLSIGLSTGTDSAADTRLAAMAECVMTQERNMPFFQFTSLSQPYYFDYQGDLLPGSTGAYYQCSVTVSSVSGALGNVTNSTLVGVTNQFTYPCGAPASARKSNSFYLQRSND